MKKMFQTNHLLQPQLSVVAVEVVVVDAVGEAEVAEEVAATLIQLSLSKIYACDYDKE